MACGDLIPADLTSPTMDHTWLAPLPRPSQTASSQFLLHFMLSPYGPEAFKAGYF